MKKIILLMGILALSFGTFSCGGGGAGPATLPPGENPGVPSVVQLLPSQNVAQTNASITLNATVLDGNGAPVANVPVYFTNLSQPFGVLSATVANTGSNGIATVNLFSSTAGFATILVQVNVGVSNVRDEKTLMFISANSFNLQPTLTLDVSSNGINFDQPGDFTLFKTPGDTQRTIRATVLDRFGLPAFNASVTFGSDAASGVTFTPMTATTDSNGQAFTLVQVSPTILTNVTTVLNITATATLTDGSTAFNLISLFLSQVTIDPAFSSVTAVPSIVSTGGTSDVTAVVMTNVDTPVPDDTSVNFTTAPKTPSDPSPCGSITPFEQTTSGVTPADVFTAPLIPGTCTVTATVGGVTIGSVDILVNTTLSVQPTNQTINGIAGGIATFTIFGGVPPYTVTSDHTEFPPTPATVTAVGETFSVTVPPNMPTTTVTYTVRDNTGTTATAILDIAGQTLAVQPTTQTVNGIAGGTATFTIFGGGAPYTVASSNASFLPTPATVMASGGTFSVAVPANTPTTTVTYTVTDNTGSTATATLDIAGQALSVQPPTQTISGVSGGTATFTVFGGAPGYTVTSNNTLFPPSTGTIATSGGTFTVTVPAGSEPVTVTYTAKDSTGATATGMLVITGITSLTLTPTTFTLSGTTIPGSIYVYYFVSGGQAPYTVYFTMTNIVSSPLNGTVEGSAGTNQFDFPVLYKWTGATTETFEVIVVDTLGAFATCTVTVTP